MTARVSCAGKRRAAGTLQVSARSTQHTSSELGSNAPCQAQTLSGHACPREPTTAYTGAIVVLCAQSTIIPACCSVYLLATSWFYQHPSIVQLFAHAPCRQMKCGSKPDATALLVFSTSILRTKLLAYFCLDQTSSCCSKRLRARAVRRGLGCCQLCLACVLLPKALLTSCLLRQAWCVRAAARQLSA